MENKATNIKDNVASIPMVSVCIQTYRHVNFIKQCLDSILQQQTNFDFEIILGEDESDDGTREICTSYAALHPNKIRLFLRSRKDVILIDGKETGRYNFKENLKACRGKYIALCEGDDYWTDSLKLQKQFEFLESNQEYSVCFHKVKILKNDQLLDDYITRVPSPSSTYSELAKGNYIHTPSVMFRNGIELPRWFDEILAGDYALHILNAMRGKLFCMNDVMAVYRVHEGGIWSTTSDEANQLRWLKVLTTLCDNLTGEIKEQLDDQRLEWAMILYNKGFQKETAAILSSGVGKLLKLQTNLVLEQNHLLKNPQHLASKVSGTFLLKALRAKLFKVQ